VSETKRHEFEVYTNEAIVDPKGGWVLYADHKDQVDALTAERDELARKLKEAEAKFEKVRKSVAWHRNGKGPDVPVLQTRYDALQHRADAAEAKELEAAALADAQIPGERLRAIAKRSRYVRELQAKLAAVRELAGSATELDAFKKMIEIDVLLAETVKES
jgi:hypothetical protein